MKLKALLVSWRQLRAEPAYSLVVILGLAIAIAATYLIALLLNDRWLPDPAVPAPNQVVRVEMKFNIPGRTDDWFDAAPYVFRDALLEAHGPIKQAARVFVEELSLRAGERLSKTVVAFTDPDLVDLFGLKALQGDIRTTLQKPDAIVLTTRAAERLFGSQRNDLIGQHVVNLGMNLVVGAIVPVQASNSEMQFDALVSLDSPSSMLAGSGMGIPIVEKSWTQTNGRVSVRLAEGATAPKATVFMQDILDRSPVNTQVPPEWRAVGRKIALVRAVPLPRVPFDGAGSASYLMLYGALSGVALMMLGLAAINYVNLSSVRTLGRQREIAIRKSLGASPLRLTLQFITESILVAMLAGVAGLLLAWLLAPGFADLLSVQFASKLFAPTQLIGLVLGCLLLGLLTGLYPAHVALGVHCAPALQGRKQSEGVGGRHLRRAMTVLQFGAAMTLSAAAVVVVWQSEYVSQLDMGFKTEGLLALQLPRAKLRGQVEGFSGALKNHPAVQGVSMSADVPGRSPIGPAAMYGNGSIRAAVRINEADLNFFGTYQIPILAGSLEGLALPDQDQEDAPDAEHPIVLDLTAVKALGFANAQDSIGKRLTADHYGGRVVAVTGAIKQESARRTMLPQAFWLYKPVRFVLTLKGQNMAALRAAVTEIWPRYFPDQVVEMNGVQEQLDQRYRLDRNVGRLIAATSLIALLLAAFGVYALAAYTVRRAALEIVIRKLHGAGHRHIAALLLKEFAPLLMLAALVSLPLIWWMSQQYLAGFVERAAMGAWPLLAAVVGTVLMSLLAGLRHGLAAMAMRPVLALRD
jgi:putative ABC transport system permease protein